MKIKYPFIALAVIILTNLPFVGAAEKGKDKCNNFDLSAFPGDLPDRVELLEVVAGLLKAHCLCEFPLAVRDHLTVSWDPRFDIIDEIFANSPECFGELKVHNVKIIDEAWIGHVMLEPRSVDVGVKYVAVEFSFQLIDGTWVHTWPNGIEHWDSGCP